MRGLVLWLGVWLLSAHQAVALTVPDGAVARETVIRDGTEHALPTGPFANGQVVRQVFEGQRRDTIWRLTPAQPVDQVADQLIAQFVDLQVIYDCQASICGGFDFRFALDVLPEPDMYVDVSNYRYVVAANPEGTEVVALMVSQSALSTFVQVTEIGPSRPVVEPVNELTTEPVLPDPPVAPITTPDPVEAGSIIGALETDGHAVLEDLTFETGSSELGAGEFASLKELAEWIAANPAVQIGIVGHTDAVGGLDANVALSKRRAASVVARLVETYGVDRARIEAMGAGYMAPRTTNQTEEGREANRRVEVILTGVAE